MGWRSRGYTCWIDFRFGRHCHDPLFSFYRCHYRKSNPLWEFLIRHRMVHTVWRPLVEVTRWQRFRSAARLERREEVGYNGVSPVVPLIGKET